MKYRECGMCPRCRHDGHLNTDGLCKPCLQAIRAEDDAQWALADPGARPRDLQLQVGAYRDYATQARQLIRGSHGGRRVNAQWRKLKQQRDAPDESAVLEAGARGQIPLFTVPRTLTEATVSAIVGRPVSGWEQTRTVLLAMEAEHGLSAGWRFKVAEMVRLTLAVREAEGAEQFPEPMLRDLPTNGDAVRLPRALNSPPWARVSAYTPPGIHELTRFGSGGVEDPLRASWLRPRRRRPRRL
jgi:hypothetical protein